MGIFQSKASQPSMNSLQTRNQVVYGSSRLKSSPSFSSSSFSSTSSISSIVAEPTKKWDEAWLNLSAEDKLEMVKYLLHTPRQLSQTPVRFSDKGIIALHPDKVEKPLRNYKYLGPIGCGCFGEVHLYRHRPDKRVYAVKSCPINKAEMIVHLLASDYKDGVSIKKIIADPSKDTMHIVMECLKPYKSVFLYPDKLNTEYGITLRDRHARNKSLRPKKNGLGHDMVEIDYGITEIKESILLQKLEANAKTNAHNAKASELFFPQVSKVDYYRC